MSFSTKVYVLRHCTASANHQTNRERPLSKLGQGQARSLVPILSQLDIAAVYTSPFRRAVETVAPFCENAGLIAMERDDLAESGQEEELTRVRSRLMGAIGSIAEAHDNTHVLVCTHGGCLWGVISHFDHSFGFEDYRCLGSPDMRRIAYEAGVPRLDQHFKFEP